MDGEDDVVPGARTVSRPSFGKAASCRCLSSTAAQGDHHEPRGQFFLRRIPLAIFTRQTAHVPIYVGKRPFYLLSPTLHTSSVPWGKRGARTGEPDCAPRFRTFRLLHSVPLLSHLTRKKEKKVFSGCGVHPTPIIEHRTRNGKEGSSPDGSVLFFACVEWGEC